MERDKSQSEAFMSLVARFCTVKHPLINVFDRPSTP